MRGFGVILTDKEKKHMAYYNNNVKTFGGMFHIDSNNKEIITKSFGARELSDRIYRPLVYTQQLPESSYVTPQKSYIRTVDDLKKYYSKKYNYNSEDFGFDLFKFKTITNSGSVMPYQQWLQRAYLEMRNLGNLPDHKQEQKPLTTLSSGAKDQTDTKENVTKKSNKSAVAHPMPQKKSKVAKQILPDIIPVSAVVSKKIKKSSISSMEEDEPLPYKSKVEELEELEDESDKDEKLLAVKSQNQKTKKYNKSDSEEEVIYEH
jgi:hypothetical protein